MGKHKSQFSLFDSYVNSQESSSNGIRDSEYIPLPDSMKTSTLLEQIGKEHHWSEEQIDADIDVLEHNRLYYIHELRELSDESWKVIELLPLVKDLLRNALDPTRKNKHKESTSYSDYKREKKLRKIEEKKRKKEEAEKRSDKTVDISRGDVNKDGSGSSSNSSSSSDSDINEKGGTEQVKNTPKVFTGRPIKPIGPNRLRVHTQDGSVFECDRLCPHKKVDLSTWGQVVGHTLVCTKHNWKFDLDTNGATKGRSVNACKVNEW
ncbi:hypothetical protein BDB01DRAFT_850389 [Pilobolus umbonatus]|nr:hypothetical protein BDB01DRAFT_850389 [Pilobolus umbonatus]